MMAFEAAHGPVHASLPEPYSGDGFTTGFDHAGADELPLFTKLRVAHSPGAGLEVVGRFADLVRQTGFSACSAAISF
jgi:hypothetical protein